MNFCISKIEGTKKLVSRDNIYYFLFLNIIEKNSQF